MPIIPIGFFSDSKAGDNIIALLFVLQGKNRGMERDIF